ncbi:MAG: hypothetical protein EOP47_02070 [Sphingobacteriaceae bacterium]|nr:MAG: hypothetical protein EOP47_02070 [Sphingobacteriaceae bacterium]
MTNGISPWAAAASNTFADDDLSVIYTKQRGDFKFTAHLINDSLWILATWPNGGKLAFRTAYSPEGELTIKTQKENTTGINFSLNSVIGEFEVDVVFPKSEHDILRYTTSLKPQTDLLIPFWPRDIIIPGNDGNSENTAGNIRTSQVGTRSGLIYFNLTRPKAGSVMYFQNITALNDYFEQTETSGAELVRGEWPELGLALPPATKKPLVAGKKIIISDAFVSFSREVPADEADMVRQYLDMMASLYLQLPLPQTQYNDWPTITNNGLRDLIENHGCWQQVGGHGYLNAYVSDYDTPPEIMVQLAVLLPIIEYTEWNNSELDVIDKIKDGLPAFYNDDLKVIMRWHPKAEGQLQDEEEQRQPRTMDAWYLHHPLMNLARLAHKGDKKARSLFLNSLEYAIKVAHKFKYSWPVFYHMETLEVLKAETEPGEGGEKDVAGIYALVMLEAYELTGEKRYLAEAEKAARTLQGMGFDLFYQGNNTTFSAKALLRLYKITKNELYLDLSYLCLANVFNNVQLWDCNYGYGKNFSTFFAVFPLSNAPYTAAYEEAEIFSALHDYLRIAEDVDILPSVKLLVAEFIRFLVHRGVYYYPPMLPKEMLSENPKTGELDPNLWIVLEDMNDGWQQCGQVGQEVYGAGNAFGILPRHYMIVPDEDFMVYVDYPTAGFIPKKGKSINFIIKGDARLTCRMMIVSNEKNKLPNFTVTAKGQKQELKGTKTKDGHLEYLVNGDQKINISW